MSVTSAASSADAFDGRGNYSLGIKEQLIFPEIEYDKIEKLRGMDIAIVHHRQDRRRGARAPQAAWALRSCTTKEENEKWRNIHEAQAGSAPAKFSTRRYNRCKICGRPHAYLRNYGICRICFRELAYKGQIPGVKKASW